MALHLLCITILVGAPTACFTAQSGVLTAGDIDDNLNFEMYLGYKTRQLQLMGQSQYLPDPYLQDRVLVHVTDQSGVPFSCAVVEIPQLQIELPVGTSGVLPLFPSLDFLTLTDAGLAVRARAPGGNCPENCSELLNIGEVGRVSLQIPAASELPSQMDVAFVVDTTGSMGDELRYLQVEIVEILGNLQSQLGRSVDTNVASILYRDVGEEYVVKKIDFGRFSASAPAIKELQRARHRGGGDFPEAMDQAMSAAAQLQWRSGNTARVAFLVADAPPHDEHMQTTLESAIALRKGGVKVYALACSGTEDQAEYLMRLMAIVTGARYVWLTDDSGVGNAHQEPKVKCFQVTSLDQLLQRVLLSELSGARIEASQSHIIREVGRQDKGICLLDFQPETTTAPDADTTDSVLDPDSDHVGDGFEVDEGEEHGEEKSSASSKHHESNNGMRISAHCPSLALFLFVLFAWSSV